MTLEGARRGALAGLVGGLATVAAMELASLLTGLRAVPDLLQQPILAVMPGPVFGFLIDNLQHAGKVVEEAGLIVAMLVALALLGAATGLARTRWNLPTPSLLAAAVAWLAVALVVLPIGGQGLLGLAAGTTTPVIWAVVFAVYWLVFDLAWGPVEAGRETDLERRRLLTLAPTLVGLGSLALIGVLKVPGWVQAVAAPPESGLTGAVPDLTPAGNFYRVSKNFQDPVVQAAGWSLRVSGLVGRQLSLRYPDLVALPATTEIVTLECISNDVGGNLMSTGRFTGIPLRDLLTMAEPRAGAGAVNFQSTDGYTESLPLSVVMGEPDILVAHQLNGARLPDAHGFPARMVVPGRYGMKGPKWLEEIEVAASEGGGFWEQQGWNAGTPVKTTSRFDSPRDGALLRREPIALAGVAFAGQRGVQAVEWSADGGRTWTAADQRPPLSPLTWVLWHATWTPAREGAYSLTVRARDGSGAEQSQQQTASFPEGARGYHTIRVNVGG